MKSILKLAALVLMLITSMMTSAQTATTTTLNDINYSSLYWIPTESGWGVHITHQGNVIFVAMYTYDVDNQPLWMVCSNCQKQSDGKTFTGDFFRVVGGTPFNGTPFSPITSSNVNVVGTMKVTFTSDSTATMTYTVNGATVIKSIQKELFGTATAKCKFQDSPDRSALTNYQDLWWNPSESGWGMSLVHQDNILFVAMYVYGSTGRNEWYVMSRGDRQSDGSFLGDLFRITGPVFNAVPFVPLGPDNQASRVTKVGTMSLKFSDGQKGVLTYSVNGSVVVKSIVRQEFATPYNACSQGISPKLIMSAESNNANGGPISIFDLTTGTVQTLTTANFNAQSCDGVSINPATPTKIVISCRAGTQPFVTYDLVTGAVNTNALALAPQSTFRTPVVCVTSGKCFYGFGNIGATGTSDGRILVTLNGVVTTSVTLPDQNSNKIPVRIKIVGNTLWVMSKGAENTSASISKFDLTTEKFVGSPIQVGVDAWDMAVNESVIAVTIYRPNANGKDVLFFSTTTSLQTGSVTVPGNSPTNNALGIAIKGDVVYVAGITGVGAYSLSTFAQVAFLATPAFTIEMATSSNRIYVVMNRDTIYGLNPTTLAVEVQFSKIAGYGRLYVAE